MLTKWSLFKLQKEHTFFYSGVKKTKVRYYIMEYNGFPAVRGRGMVLTLVKFMSGYNVYND